MAGGLQLRLTGTPFLRLALGDERSLDPHGALIAARLALCGPQNRATLAGLLWPDAAPARARANLRQRLLRLRALAECDWILGQATLRLAPDVRCLPVDDPQAAGLLEGVALPLSEDLAAWLSQAREQAQAARASSVLASMAKAEAEQRFGDALLAAQRLLEIDSLAEAHHRDLIRLHYLNEDKAKAIACYETLRTMLLREFAAEPSAQTQALLQLILAPSRPLSIGPNRGPAPVTLQRPPRLVGREAEIAALGGLLGQGGVALLLGEAGIGKTRLLKELLSGREQVLLVKAEAGDAGVPYALLARLLRHLLQGRDAVLIAARREVAGRANPLICLLPELALEPQGSAPEAFEKLHLAEALASIFALAQLNSVAVDDLHFADAASIEMLLVLLGSEHLTRLTWCFTQRPGEGSPASFHLRNSLLRAGRLLLLPLPPLDRGQMAELLQAIQLDSWLGRDVEAMAAKLTQHCGGNPLFALETLKQMLAQGGPSGPGDQMLPKPASVLALIKQRLSQLSELALALARTAAVAGPEFSVELAAHVLQRPAIEFSAAWSELEQAQVLRDGGFAHDLVAEAVLSSIPALLKQHLHASMAEWLAQWSDEPARLAAHWLAAGKIQRAAPCLLAAADRAHNQLRPVEEAAFLLQWVKTLTASRVDLLVAALLRLARVQVEAQGFEAAIGPLERALALAADDAMRVQVLNLRAEMQFNRLLPQASAGSAEQAFKLASSLGAAAAEPAAEALLRWHRALCLAGQAARGEQLWQQHQAALAPAIASLGPELLSDRGWVLDRLGDVREARVWHSRALVLAQAAHRPFDEAIVLGNLAQSLLLSGEPAAADAVLDRAEALSARHAGLHASSDYVALYRGMAAAACGRFAEALRRFDQALSDTSFQSQAARHAVLSHRAMLWATLGQSSRAQADAAAVLIQTDLPPWVLARAHCARAMSAGREGMALALEQAIKALGDSAQRALDAPVRLWLCRLAAAGPQDGLLDALRTTREILQLARRGGHAGLRWASHWSAAQLCCAADQKPRARRHALACLARPAGELASLIAEGQWWHGLWRVWLALGDRQRAELARAAGLAWLEQSVQGQLSAEFAPSFRDALPEHRALLSGQAAN
jgi:DNA-binding SARP family transcriptional activator/Flp pilus assembly protein TadD